MHHKREYKPSNINGQLFGASLRFIKENERLVNNKAKQAISERGYIKRAQVTQVTTICDTATVVMRADGVKIEFEVKANDLEMVYKNPKGYAERYL